MMLFLGLRIRPGKMTTRSAENSLKGYFYQFDKTIQELINLKLPSDSVIVEGIEDLDVVSAMDETAIQCKYLEGQKYRPSLLRQPLIFMLTHFLEKRPQTRYCLYAYFKDGSGPSSDSLTEAELKSILTYKEDSQVRVHHVDNNISDDDLRDFITRLKITTGPTFEQQKQDSISAISRHFCCTNQEAEGIFYNNALRFVFEKAIRNSVQERSVTKAEFLSVIDTKVRYFSQWLCQLKGERAFTKYIKEEITRSGAFRPQASKCIFVTEDFFRNTTAALLPHIFIHTLIDKTFAEQKTVEDARPWTLILDIPESQINELKKRLLENNIRYNDGFETLAFHPEFFAEEPVITRMTKPNHRRLPVIGKASYWIRIVSSLNYKLHRAKMPKFYAAVFASKGDPKEYYDIALTQVFHIPFADNFGTIANILV